MGSITFSCPDGWEIKAPDCYLFVDFEMPFEKASDMCGTYGASLVHIEDEVEAKDVGHMVQQHNNKWKHYWIGNMVNAPG
nr:hypothetical protein BaRGS_008585 [Batillaria attramentaria]